MTSQKASIRSMISYSLTTLHTLGSRAPSANGIYRDLPVLTVHFLRAGRLRPGLRGKLGDLLGRQAEDDRGLLEGGPFGEQRLDRRAGRAGGRLDRVDRRLPGLQGLRDGGKHGRFGPDLDVDGLR